MKPVWARGNTRRTFGIAVIASLTLGIVSFLGGIAAAAANPLNRSQSAQHRQCIAFAPAIDLKNLTPGHYSIFTVGGLDSTGCNSWPYNLVYPIPPGFWGGPGFHSGVAAYEYNTREVTELKDGKQLISVTDPTRLWLGAYAGYDVCTKHGTEQVCVALAVVHRPDYWWLYIPAGVLLLLLVLFVIHNARPASAIRRRQRFRTHHRALEHAVDGHGPPALTVGETKRLQRRMRRLERSISSELSESQHQWFRHTLSSARHATALEALARWCANSPIPVPSEVREEFRWLAAALEIEDAILPIVEANLASIGAAPTDTTIGRGEMPGFDVPLDVFRQLVSEALDSLPEQFRRAMTNVAITVEEQNENSNIQGLYIGIPLTQPHFRQWHFHPDRIIIYRRGICAYARSEEEVRARVYVVVLHEIAHHFGISDERLTELGWA